MHRLLIALLAAFDAVIAAASGIAVVLAPLTLLWVIGLGGGADWTALWPASGTIWQLGHLVPLAVTLPEMYLAAAGIDPAAAAFSLSLAPLAFAASTALFAARSGRRAAAAGAPGVGAIAGALVFAAIAAAVAFTAGNPVAAAAPWQAILLPALVYGVPALLSAIFTAWRVDTGGPIARLRARVHRLSGAWAALPELLVRGTALAVTGLVGVGALVAGVAVFVRGGQVVALYEAANVDVIGAVVIALAQLAYVPTLAVWGLSYAAGPGFAVGTGSAVSPAGTQVGVVPGIPVLGAVPDSTTSWMLLLVLLPLAVGAFTGWMLRSRLAGLPAHGRAGGDGGYGARLALAVGVAVSTGAVAALLAAVASGSIGPGRLAEVGPDPGPLALVVGLEILVGAAILLLAPRRRDDEQPPASSDADRSAERDTHSALWRSISAPPMYVHSGHESVDDEADAAVPPSFSENETAPLDLSGAVPGDTVPGDTVPRDTVPGDAVPGDAVPGDAVPGDATPGDGAPRYDVPHYDVPGDDVAWGAEDAEWFAADDARAGRPEGAWSDGDERGDANATEPIPGFERGGDEPSGDESSSDGPGRGRR